MLEDVHDVPRPNSRLNVKLLGTLRLVSRPPWKSATRVLHINHRFSIGIEDPFLPTALHMLLQPPAVKSVGDFATGIQRFCLDFSKFKSRKMYRWPIFDDDPPLRKVDWPEIFGKTEYEPNFLLKTPYDLHDQSHHRYNEMVKVLPIVLQRLCSLSALEFRFPPWMSDDHDGIIHPMNLGKVEALMDGVVRSLQTPNLKLSSLDLRLLCTFHVQEVSNVLPKDITASLNHLSIWIRDATGMQGHENNLFSAGIDEGDDEDPDDIYEVSELQQMYPNVEYASAVFNLLHRCPNLRSLELVGSHFLDATDQSWCPPLRLERLHLERIRLSEDKLLGLIHHSSAGEDSLKALWLKNVELTTGTWSRVFHEILCHASKLSYVDVCGLQYHRYGTSSHLRVSRLGPNLHYSAKTIWTTSESDWKSLAALKQSMRQSLKQLKAEFHDMYDIEEGDVVD